MNKGDKILSDDGTILELVGKVLPAGNNLKFLYRFEALNKSRYVEMSFESALMQHIAYLKHKIKAMEMGVPGVWFNFHHEGYGGFNYTEISSEKPAEKWGDAWSHYIFKNGEWIADE